MNIFSSFIQSEPQSFWNKLALWVSNAFIEVGEAVVKWGKESGGKIVGCILIIIIGFWASKIIARIFKKAMSKSKVDKGVVTFMSSSLKTFLKLIVIVSAVAALGVNITSVVAALGAAGITAGLAVKDTLANFAGGVVILFNRPFKVGDYIETSDSSGTVSKIELIFTTLVTVDNKQLIVPNSQLIQNKLINCTAEGSRRLDLSYKAPYSADSQAVKEVLLAAYKDCAYVKADSAEVGIAEFSDSAVMYEVRAWIDSSDYVAAKFALMEKVKYAFEENGIIMPRNNLDVRIENK
ncbi:MAG: mechanosensitive ion channel family protein [Oscillospiraceae bacterium]|nr:mechanosensitive ion channel family protein [Oscillospiraceae bacterium]